jgi:Cu/Ag efflux protein CusF
MKKLIGALLVAALAAFAWFSLPPAPRLDAEKAAGGHAGHGGDPMALAHGTVLAVDRSANNITISHGPVPHLGMPPMTMGFRVVDPALLATIKAGDEVRFHVDAIGGALTVTRIERAAQ